MCRVLILDDDTYSAETIKLILENSGEATADVVATVEDAINQTARSMRVGKPYEVFLIDQRLGIGKDGIDAFKDLRVISPDSDGIIFTGYKDAESGLRAYESGAFRYLSKPFENKELLFLLKALKEWRKEQREHDWQKLLRGMMETVLQQHDFGTVSKVIVENSLKMGYERAHLFWIPTRDDVNKDGLFVGIACAGKGCVPNFEGRLYPLEDWYDLNQPSPSGTILSRKLKTEEARKQLEIIGYQPPVILPLSSGVTLAGVLVLDHEQNNRILNEHKRSLLSLFAQQASIVLHHARTISSEQKTLQESSIVRNISRQITTKAASVNLIELLDEVRQQIGQLMDVSNFAVILLGQETEKFEFHLLYENNKRRQGIRISNDHVLEGYLLNQSSEVFIPRGMKEFINANNLQTYGKLPSSFLGVLLHIGEQVVGGIVVKKFGIADPFTKHEKELLISVADQIAGAIQIRRFSESEKEDSKHLQVLQQASMELLRVTQKYKDYFWYTVLTIATADFGLGFNRALLFLIDENNGKLICRSAIGTENSAKAVKEWRRDKKRGFEFSDFFRGLEKGKIRFTDFDILKENIRLNINDLSGVLKDVWQSGNCQIVLEQHVVSSFPSNITEKVQLSTCAVVPLRLGNAVRGFVIVDNKHNHKPLNKKAIDSLQTLLNNAGQVYETSRQQDKSRELLSANYAILNQASPKPSKLRETLDRICLTARKITEADWVLVYPLFESAGYKFDIVNTSYSGYLKFPIGTAIKERPSLHGISAYVLDKGEIVIRDVDHKSARIRRLKIASHQFIKREGVKAIIGIAIYDVQTKKAVGILYFDYRTAQDFTDLEIHHARSFASLIAFAISNTRKFDERRLRLRMDAALQTVDAIGTELDLEKMIGKVLEKLRLFFENATLCVLTYDESEDALRFAPSTVKIYRVANPLYYNQQLFPLNGKSIACKIARKSLKTEKPELENVSNVGLDPNYLPLIPNTISELCVSLMSSEKKLLGVLVLERSERNFDDDDVELVEMVARQLSLGMERAKQREDLDFKSTVAAAYAWAADIAHDINREVGLLQGIAYLIKNNPNDPRKVSEWAEKIQQSSRSLSSAGVWRKPETKTILLDAMVQNAISDFALHSNVEVDFSLNCGHATINIDPIAFERILRHIVRNSAQAMENMPHKKIVVSTKIQSGMAEIQLRDLGPGIAPEVWSSLLQRRITTKGNEGGFGLLFTRQLVEDMGGRIRLMHPPDGIGAMFTIGFPITF